MYQKQIINLLKAKLVCWRTTVIYWIEKEVAQEAGEDFRVDDSVDISLYS